MIKSNITQKMLFALTFVASALLSGCAVQHGCDAAMAGLTVCVDYRDTSNNLALSTAHCSALGGTQRFSACATANRIARCDYRGMAQLNYTVNFYAPATMVEASAACQAIFGEFTPGP